MSNPSNKLASELAALEPVDSAARQHYEKCLRDILEARLRFPARCLCAAAGAACLAFAAAAAYAVFFDREAYGYWPNLLLGAVVTGTAASIGAALILVAVRGVYRRRREGRLAATMCVLLLGGWGAFMLIASFGLPEALRHVFLVLGLACLGAAAWMAQRLSTAAAHAALHLRLLELEYRLAELLERGYRA